MSYSTCNWWQYSRWIYNIGRSIKLQPLSETERTAVIAFIEGMVTARPMIAGKVFGCQHYSGGTISQQNDICLGKIVQIIGRNLKQYPAGDDEKTSCDTLMETTGNRKDRLAPEEGDESSSSEESDESSSSGSSSSEESDESSSSGSSEQTEG